MMASFNQAPNFCINLSITLIDKYRNVLYCNSLISTKYSLHNQQNTTLFQILYLSISHLNLI